MNKQLSHKESFHIKKPSEVISLETKENLKNKVPIKRGCKNPSCFCTGACREIIGYRDRIIGEL